MYNIFIVLVLLHHLFTQTLQVLGHSKTILVLLGGWLFLGDAATSRKLLGMTLAVLGMIWCVFQSWLVLAEDMRYGSHRQSALITLPSCTVWRGQCSPRATWLCLAPLPLCATMFIGQFLLHMTCGYDVFHFAGMARPPLLPLRRYSRQLLRS